MYEENPYENPADEVAADEIGGGTAEDGRELPTGRTPWDTLSARVISLVRRATPCAAEAVGQRP